jgi:hypothetical protein
MSPRKLDFIYVQIGFRTDQIAFLDAEAKRRGTPRVQVVRDAVDNYRIFLQNGSANTPIQSTDAPDPQQS